MSGHNGPYVQLVVGEVDNQDIDSARKSIQSMVGRIVRETYRNNKSAIRRNVQVRKAVNLSPSLDNNNFYYNARLNQI